MVEEAAIAWSRTDPPRSMRCGAAAGARNCAARRTARQHSGVLIFGCQLAAERFHFPVRERMSTRRWHSGTGAGATSGWSRADACLAALRRRAKPPARQGVPAHRRDEADGRAARARDHQDQSPRSSGQFGCTLSATGAFLDVSRYSSSPCTATSLTLSDRSAGVRQADVDVPTASIGSI